MSRPYFTQIFTRETGQPPAAYLTALRISKAKRLMADNPSLAVAEVARAVGYDNPARFSKAFRRLEGVSPKSRLRRRSARTPS